MWGADQTVNSTRSQIQSSLIGQILLDFFLLESEQMADSYGKVVGSSFLFS